MTDPSATAKEIAMRGRVGLLVLWCSLLGASCSNPAEENLRKGNVFFSHGQLDEAEAAYRRSLEAEPGSVLALEGLGNVRFERGDLDGAIARYEEAVEASGRTTPRRSGALSGVARAVNARHRLAIALTERGDLEGAVRALEGALALDRTDVYAHYALGGLEARRGRRAEAEARQREALRVEPQHRGARFALTSLLVDLGRFEEAELELARLEAAGASALAEYGWARLWGRRGRPDLAARHLGKVLDLGVTHPARVLADEAFTSSWTDPAMAVLRARIEATSARALSAARPSDFEVGTSTGAVVRADP